MADEFAPSVNDPASPTVGMDLDDDNRSIRSGSDEMLLSSTATTAIAAGKAYQFVERVLALHDRLKDPFVAASTPHMIQPLAVDDLVHTTERLLMTQAEFRAAGKPTTVDLGYHYTSRRNVDSIRTDGLQSRGELDTNHNPRTSGLLYGTGIYIATNPSAFNGPYGSVGLLVARLRGAEADYNMVGPNFDRGNDLAIIFAIASMNSWSCHRQSSAVLCWNLTLMAWYPSFQLISAT